MGILDRDRLAGQPARLAGGQPEPARGGRDLAERLGQRLAVLEDEVAGHRLTTGIDDVGDALELGRAFEGGPPAVALERLVREPDRSIDVCRSRGGDLGHGLAGRGAGQDRRAAVRGVRPFAAHEEPMAPGPHTG